MKIRSLDTIAALRELAENMRNSAPEARAAADKAGSGPSPASKGIARVLREEAAKFETIASELEEIADEVAHARAFATARYLVGPVALVSEVDVMAAVNTIREAPAFTEYTAPLSANQKSTCTVRLVPFYDETLNEERWAVHYTTADGDEGIADNASQEDAEWRYWEIAGPLGQVRPE